MSDVGSHSPTVPRLSTGIAGLDTLLMGGLLTGEMYLVIGRPGTGKTILANQIAFHHVAQAGRAVYVTLLAESHARMLDHIRSLSFFDPSHITDALTYISGYEALVEGGLEELRRLLRSLVRDQHATLLLIDGLRVAETLAPTRLDFNHFLQEMQVFNTAMGCTTLLMTTYPQDASLQADETTVDGVFRLHNDLLGQRALREFEIDKFRGSSHLRGRHTFQILGDGITIFPRTEVLLGQQWMDTSPPDRRLSFGAPALDTMLTGGVNEGSTTMILGPPGSGKTCLGLQFLHAGLQEGQHGLFFGFYETPQRLLGKARRFGLQFENYVAQGQLELLWNPPLEDNIDRLAGLLLEALKRCGARRLFIDGIDGFRQCALHPQRLPFFFTALMNELQAHNVTTLYSLETHDLTGPPVNIPVSSVSALTETMITLRYVEAGARVHRLINVSKMRYSDYDPSIREFRITDHGIDVAASSVSAEAVLTGPAQSLNQASSGPPSGKRGGRR